LIGPDEGWQFKLLEEDGSYFEVFFAGQKQGEVNWELIGMHNVVNGLASIAAARHAGVPAHHCCDALSEFKNVKRRMELKGEAGGVAVYDDFAHHPTAVETTLQGFRKKVGDKKIIAILDLRSATMRSGIHKDTLIPTLVEADEVIIHKPAEYDWQFPKVQLEKLKSVRILSTVDDILQAVAKMVQSGDQILVMSNGGFGGIHSKLLEQMS
jgi:UDP-N-acetylmuramate: L-alanyl-gamma-D-glutamyl-meso-diaminopimelate ligase